VSEPTGIAAADANTQLAMRRTGMAFQRTRMAADRTLMAEIGTALSLISFGFTIYQIFNKLKEAGVLRAAGSARQFRCVARAARYRHAGPRHHLSPNVHAGPARAARVDEIGGLIFAQSQFPPSLTLIVAVILLVIGVAAAVSMLLHVGPYE